MTPFRATGDPIVDLKPPSSVSDEEQRARLDALAKLNQMHMEEHPGRSELAARISSYELAYRMQSCAPEAVNIDNESDATKKLYGLNEKITEPFGRQCLLARRLVENGVRFVQLFHGGMGKQFYDTWDAHEGVKANHMQHAAEFGYKAEQQPISYHDLHASILNLLGMDHKRLSLQRPRYAADGCVRRVDSADRGVAV